MIPEGPVLQNCGLLCLEDVDLDFFAKCMAFAACPPDYVLEKVAKHIGSLCNAILN